MVFKINLSTKNGKTYRLETEALGLNHKQLGDKIKGEELSHDFAGYELEITGASDLSGFTSMKNIQGFGLKKVLLTYGKAMHKRPKGLKKKPRKPQGGLRLRKTVRGNIITDAMSQINIKVLKEGHKKLSDMFPEQNKAATEAPPSQEQAEAVKENREEKKAEKELAHPRQEPKEELPAKFESEKD